MDKPDVKIYWILEGGGEPLSFKDLHPETILSPQELARWKAMRFEKRRSEFLLGRYTAKRLLTSTYLPRADRSFPSLEILNEPEGAPYLDDPGMPGSLSISHRTGSAAAAYCLNTDCPVGIDLESIENREWSFVEDFFTPEETQYLKKTPDSVQPALVTLIWSAKEAILKTWRKGLRLDTRNIEIQPPTNEGIESLTHSWVQLEAKIIDPIFPACTLYGRVQGNTILTLAHTKFEPKRNTSLIDVSRAND